MVNIAQTIKKQNFTIAAQLIETNPRGLAATEWSSILQDIFNSEANAEILLSQFGRAMEFGTNKLMFYLAFKRFLDGKSDGFIIASDTKSNFEHKGFLDFERQIMFLLGGHLYVSSTCNVDSTAYNTLKEIRWDKLAEEEASYFNHSKFTVIQHLFNATN